jgi:PAS domain S-box-containing protein
VEQRLRSDEARAEFPAVLDVLNDPVLGSDETGRIRYANAAAGRLLGWAASDLVGRPLTSLMPSRMHAAHEEGFSRFVRTREPKIIGKPIRVPALLRDGAEIEIELTLSLLPSPPDRLRVIAVMRDLRVRLALERRIAAQRKILAQHAAVGALAGATTAEAALPMVLEATAQALEWDLGIYWSLSAATGRLAPSACWSCGSSEADEFVAVSRGRTFGAGEGLPGLALASGESMWSRDVRRDPRFDGAPIGTVPGLRSALLVPVQGCRERPWGVLEYLSRRDEEPDDELYQTMKAVAFQICQFLARVENEKELRRAWAKADVERRNLRDAEERLRLAIEAGDVGTWDYDPESRAVRADDRYRRLFGVGHDAPFTLDVIVRAIHPEDRQRVSEALERAFDARSGGEYTIEYRTTGIDDGRERWVSMRGRVMFDEHARAARFVGSGTDITNERRAMERLRFLAAASTTLSSSLDHRATLVELAQLAVPRLADWCLIEIVGDDGKIEQAANVHADAEKARLTVELRRRYPPEATPKAGVMHVLRKGQPLFAPAVTEELLAQAASDRAHLDLLRALGLRSGMVLPIKIRDGTVAVLSLFHGDSGRRYVADDLTFAEEVARRAGIAIENARLYERATKAIGIRDQFLSIASHELRTPLTPLTLQLSTLMRTIREARVTAMPLATLAKQIGIMDKQAARLTVLIDELLDVSRISTGRLEIKRDQVDLSSLLADVVARASAEASKAGVVILTDLPSRLAGRWDPGRLDQVFTNLINNAVKYAPGRPLHVGAAWRGHEAVVTFRDEGPGIAPADQQRIFGQFERAAPASMGGLGLGLWIASRIVDAHMGRIELASTPGEGSTFTVHLPPG